MITFQKNVTTSGVPVQLQESAIQDSETLVIKAKNANTGVIYVGISAATALKTAGLSFTLQKNEAVSLKIDNAYRVWIDASVGLEGVECLIA